MKPVDLGALVSQAVEAGALASQDDTDAPAPAQSHPTNSSYRSLLLSADDVIMLNEILLNTAELVRRECPGCRAPTGHATAHLGECNWLHDSKAAKELGRLYLELTGSRLGARPMRYANASNTRVAPPRQSGKRLARGNSFDSMYIDEVLNLPFVTPEDTN